jgi:hypothetical protein
MKAHSIEPGARFEGTDAGTRYTVEEVYPYPDNDLVECVVRYDVDGGNGVRSFGYDQDVPLTPPGEPQ